MKTKGIKVLDENGNVLSVVLSDILEEVSEKNSLYWSILFLDGSPNPGQGPYLSEYESKVNNSENGLLITLNELIVLSGKYFQLYEVIVLADKNRKPLHCYETESEMYKSCEIVIDLIDCAFWEIYSKNPNLITKFKDKFQKTELLEI